jgi:hypothetical protein
VKSTSLLAPSLTLCLLLATLGHSIEQPAPPQKSPDKPRLRLPALLSSQPLKEDPKDDPMRKLLKARYNAAVAEAIDYFEQEDLAKDHAVCRLYSQDQLYAMWQRVVKSGLEVCETPAQKVALLAQYLEVAREAEKELETNYSAGRCSIGDVQRARYERLDAEIQLLRARRDVERAKGR